MSVEGLWWLRTNTVDDPASYAIGGVLVLETGRLLGGDSAVAYIGRYEVNGDEVTGEARTIQYNTGAEVENIFGLSEENDQIEFVVRWEDETMAGVIWAKGNPDRCLPIVLQFVHPLP